MSSADYADALHRDRITEKEKELGFYEDFSDFDSYPKDATLLNPIFDIFTQLIDKNRKVIVLTARGKSYPVKKFLKDNGIPNVPVYAVGGSDPQLKVNVVEFFANNHDIDGISLFEDNEKNIKAIKSFMENTPGLDFKYVRVPHIDWLSKQKVKRNSRNK